MSRWDWNRIAYVLFVLAVFSALVKVGGMTLAESGPATPVAADAAPATAEREPPWYMGTFLELEDDRGFLFDPAAESAERSAPQEPSVTQQDSSSVEASSEAPIFYRPSKGTGTGPVCANLSGASKESRVVFPLVRRYSDSYSDTWGAPRPQGGHEGADLMVPAGTPEYAVTDGTVVAVSGANENGWNTLGGYTVMIEAADAVGPIKAGDLFYYAHMDAPSELPIGTSVRAGQVVGYAGDTGQGPEGTIGLFPEHLHLGWYDGSGGRTEVESGAMNPYPLLEWLKGNGGSVSGGSNASYCEAPQTGGPRPSGGDDDWPIPANPGERPDLDTGSDHARPSPAIEQRTDGDAPSGDDTRDAPRESTPEEPGEVRLGAPNPLDEGGEAPDRDFGGEIPGGGSDDGAGDDREAGPGDLPDFVGRIVGDGRVMGPADDPLRLREGMRTIFSGLLADRADRRGPQPDDQPDEDRKDGGGKDDPKGEGDGRKGPPGKGDPPRDDPGPDDGPDPVEGDSPDEDAAQGDEVAETEGGDGEGDGGEAPSDGPSEDAQDEASGSSAQDGDTPPPPGD